MITKNDSRVAHLSSEEVDCGSSLKLNFLNDKSLSSAEGMVQRWVSLSIHLVSGQRMLETLTTEEVMLCRAPADELGLLIDQLDEMLDGTREETYFEPAEPSFELNFARTKRGGIKVEVWLDAGNGITGIYTWDAAGIRFMTSVEKLRHFVEQLRAVL